MPIPPIDLAVNQFYLSKNAKTIYQIVELDQSQHLIFFLCYSPSGGSPLYALPLPETDPGFRLRVARLCTLVEIDKLKLPTLPKLLITLPIPTTLYALQYHDGKKWITETHTTDPVTHDPKLKILKDNSPMRDQPWRIATYHFATAEAFDAPPDETPTLLPPTMPALATINNPTNPAAPPRVLPNFIAGGNPLLSYKPGDEEYNR